MSRRIALLVGVLCALTLPRRAAAQEAVEYYATDAIGSVRVVFASNGNVKGRMDFGPYGEQLTTAEGIGQKVFAQTTFDGESAMDYAEARMFQLRTGRFNAPDSVYAGLEDPQRWNRYAYARNSAVNFVDPEGTFEVPVHCGVGPQYCPGNIQIAPGEYINIDGQFNPQAYGYHGGEGERAEARYADAVDSVFLAQAIFGSSGQTGGEGGEVVNGPCTKRPRCSQITNNYKDGKWKDEERDENIDTRWHSFLVNTVAVNVDGAMFGDTIYKVTNFVHVTIQLDGRMTYDGRLDYDFASLAYLRSLVTAKEPTGTYFYYEWVSPWGYNHADWKRR